jgi:hypothetical protein
LFLENLDKFASMVDGIKHCGMMGNPFGNMMGSITRLGGGAGFTIGGCKLISGGLAIGGDGGFS